jgi:hypothetical protein
MKLITLLICSFISTAAFSKINLAIDLKSNLGGKEIELQDKIEIDFNQIKAINIPGSNQLIELSISNNIPELFPDKNEPSEDALFIDMKIIKVENGKREVVSSPKVLTIYGVEAKMERFKSNEKKTPELSLKLLPTKI